MGFIEKRNKKGTFQTSRNIPILYKMSSFFNYNQDSDVPSKPDSGLFHAAV